VHARLLLESELGQFIGRQALSLAFEDVFLLMAVLFVVALVIVPFCKTVILSDVSSSAAPDGH
jgi:DHA2 family multidrug resistance protein